MKYFIRIIGCSLFYFVTACASNFPLLLRTVDFMRPTVSEHAFSVRAGIGTNVYPTSIVIVTSAMSPGFSDQLEISNGNNITEIITFFDGGFSLLPGLEIYSIDFGVGLKYQMIGGSHENG